MPDSARLPMNEVTYSQAYARVAKIMAEWPKAVPFDQTRLNQRLLIKEN